MAIEEFSDNKRGGREVVLLITEGQGEMGVARVRGGDGLFVVPVYI